MATSEDSVTLKSAFQGRKTSGRRATRHRSNYFLRPLKAEANSECGAASEIPSQVADDYDISVMPWSDEVIQYPARLPQTPKRKKPRPSGPRKAYTTKNEPRLACGSLDDDWDRHDQHEDEVYGLNDVGKTLDGNERSSQVTGSVEGNARISGVSTEPSNLTVDRCVASTRSESSQPGESVGIAGDQHSSNWHPFQSQSNVEMCSDNSKKSFSSFRASKAIGNQVLQDKELSMAEAIPYSTEQSSRCVNVPMEDVTESKTTIHSECDLPITLASPEENVSHLKDNYQPTLGGRGTMPSVSAPYPVEESEALVKCESYGKGLANKSDVLARRKTTSKLSRYFSIDKVYVKSCLLFPGIDAGHFGLIQERLAHNPFQLLVAVIFLHQTKGSVSVPVLLDFLRVYPNPESLAPAMPEHIEPFIRFLGLQNKRAKFLVALAKGWLVDPPTRGRRFRYLHYPQRGSGTDILISEQPIPEEDSRHAWEIAHMPGIGRYALDSWRVFCRDALLGKPNGSRPTSATTKEDLAIEMNQEWTQVLPSDKELRAYLQWRWIRLGWLWDPLTGARVKVEMDVVRSMERGDLSHYQGFESPWLSNTGHPPGEEQILGGYHDDPI